MNAHETQADRESAAGEWSFTFGVSGHRDTLEDDAAELEKQVRTVFDRFRLAYSNGSFELLSPLADGADRIAAEVALRAGLRVVVPLPMAQAEYERDFNSTESLHEFRRLLATAASTFEVSSDEACVRADKYAAVGDYIAGPSHTLPTGGAGASFAGLTVDQFQRRTSVVEYDRGALKINRRSAPNLLVLKRHIKYIYKAEERGPQPVRVEETEPETADFN